jgi:general secretion pathway protein K
MDRPKWRGLGSRRGLALVSVLWVLTMLALIAASFTRTTHSEINLARNAAENARAEALADAGVSQAVLGLLDTDPARSWRVDGTVYAWRYGGAEIRAAAQDEGGKIDLNTATDELLRNLFLAIALEGDGIDSPEDEALRLEPEAADALVDAIGDFRDTDDLRRLNGAEDEDYAAEGLPYGAKDGPFDAVEELMQVFGMTAPVFEAVAPALTVYSRKRRPREATASPLVRAALSGTVPGALTAGTEGGDAEGEAGEVEPELSETPQVLEGALAGTGRPARSRTRVYAVHVEARLDSGAVFVRDAVVQVTNNPELPFEFRGWRQGRRTLFPEEEKTAAE